MNAEVAEDSHMKRDSISVTQFPIVWQSLIGIIWFHMVPGISRGR